jgi:hypothetical protein
MNRRPLAASHFIRMAIPMQTREGRMISPDESQRAARGTLQFEDATHSGLKRVNMDRSGKADLDGPGKDLQLQGSGAFL